MNIVGITKKQVFKDEKTGYTGFFLSVKGEDKIIFCKGIMQQLSCNLPVQLEGNFKVQDDRHYFSFTSYTILNENISILNSTELLSEKDCFTIGNQLPDLTQIKSAYDIKSVIDDNKLASQIYNKVHRMLLNYNLCKLIITAGGKYCNYTKALNKIGENAYDKLIKNPYKYGAMCEMKFSVCDNIAKKYKISKLDRRRVYGLLNYILYDALNNGDTYILSDDLDSYIKKFDISEEIPAEYIYAIAYSNDSYICENGKIYLRNIYAEEKNVAKAVLKLQRLASQSVLDEPLLNKIITANNIELSVSQRKACECLTNEGISIITGGPGTGKTTLTNILIQYLKEKYKNAEIITIDSHARTLDLFLEENGALNEYPQSVGLDIQIDVLGIVKLKNKTLIVFIEAKKTALNIRDLGQLWAYCRLCDPAEAFLMSSVGSGSLNKIMLNLNRYDLLNFEDGKTIKNMRICKWDISRNAPDLLTMVPKI